MYGNTNHQIVEEDGEFLRNWDNFVLLQRLPHELGYAEEPYPEDLEGLKVMKRWMREKEEKEAKKKERRQGLMQRANAAWANSQPQ